MDDDRRKHIRRTAEAGSARAQCYADIRASMKTRLLTYYQSHPNLLGDERSQRAIKESTEGLASIFDILDRYRIEPIDSSDEK